MSNTTTTKEILQSRKENIENRLTEEAKGLVEEIRQKVRKEASYLSLYNSITVKVKRAETLFKVSVSGCLESTLTSTPAEHDYLFGTAQKLLEEMLVVEGFTRDKTEGIQYSIRM